MYMSAHACMFVLPICESACLKACRAYYTHVSLPRHTKSHSVVAIVISLSFLSSASLQDDWFALQRAAAYGQTAVAEVLLDNGADINMTDSVSDSVFLNITHDL
jgi:hypothetical protein